MAIDDIIERIRKANRPLVLVTGGEPMAQRHCVTLLEKLQPLGALVQLETSGAYNIAKVPDFVRRILDIKTPGSGEHMRNRWGNVGLLRDGDEIKFCLTSRADFDWSVECISQHGLDNLGIPLLFSPCEGMVSPRELTHWILNAGINVRLQLQQHKVIWGAEAQQV